MRATVILIAVLLSGTTLDANNAESSKCVADATEPTDNPLAVFEFTMENVHSERALLAIIDYMDTMDGVHEVKCKSFNRSSHEAQIELFGEPRIQTNYRTYLEGLLNLRVKLNTDETSKVAGLSSTSTDTSLPDVKRIKVVIANVHSESALLATIEAIEIMSGVHEVKRHAFDRNTNEALIEIIGEQSIEKHYRAYLEKLFKPKVGVKVKTDDKLHEKYPDWFKSPSS